MTPRIMGGTLMVEADSVGDAEGLVRRLIPNVEIFQCYEVEPGEYEVEIFNEDI